MGFLLKGILIGLLFGLPAGAVGALTVQRTLQHGAKAGLLTGLGSSLSDCFYASVGAFGLTLVSDFLLRHQMAIYILGGGLVFLMGIRLLRKKGGQETAETGGIGFGKMFFSSLVVGITNPAAILTFLFAFSWFGLSGGMAVFDGLLLVCGVFLGTYLWWSVLTLGAVFAMRRAKKINLHKMNQIFGMILCLLGATVFLRQIF